MPSTDFVFGILIKLTNFSWVYWENKKMFLLNSFSLNMVEAFPTSVNVKEISLEEAKVLAANAQSAVGHADTASVFADQLGVSVPAARVTVSLNSGDTVLVGQYRGPRLPEGCTTLPAGATIQWLLVEIR